MHEGHVRAILWRHTTRGSPAAPGDASLPAPAAPSSPSATPDVAVPAPLPDPNALMPVADLAQRLARLDDAGQRRLAADYVALWARTFRTLVTHLRGRPERALALFADEVYPFLRGERGAARIEQAGHRRATLLLAGGLPDAYVAGLVQSFVRLTGARASVAPDGPGRFVVSYRVAPADRLARIVQHASALRLNLVLAAVLAAVVGVALADGQGAALSAVRVLVVLIGIIAAQLGGNALHALRHGHPAGPLAPLRQGPAALRSQLVATGIVAAGAAAWLAATGTPLVLLFAAAGLLAGLLYAPLRDRGLGPVVTLVLYGPLIAEGALHAFPVGAHHLDHIALLPWTLVPGALAAASLYVDDLADAPLDQAGGKRTLAVRLPGRSQGIVYTALLSLGLAPFVLVADEPSLAIAVLVAAVAAIVLAVRVRLSLGDPRRLAPARLGTQALHAAATVIVALAVAGGVP